MNFRIAKRTLLTLNLGLLFACSSVSPAPTFQEIRNATLIGVHSTPIVLRDGRWDGERFEGSAAHPWLVLIDDFYEVGDLDGDNSADAMVIAAMRTGGSGTFYYLIVMARQDRNVVNIGSAYVGDRIRIQGGRIENSQAILELVQSGPGDGSCCPTHKVTRAWMFANKYLAEVTL